MRVLGLDPSLTNFGWALHDSDATLGTPQRCIRRGRFQTSSKTMYIGRYMDLRSRLSSLVGELKPDRIGLEFPVFNDLYSEGMYGLFLFVSESLYSLKQDVVFWSPMQVKAHAREAIRRPGKWKMMKPDMVEAAKFDTGGGMWNHNEADAYLVAKLAARFWLLQAEYIQPIELTPEEAKFFTEIKTPKKGIHAGQEQKKGVLYREDSRFFLWSKPE